MPILHPHTNFQNLMREVSAAAHKVVAIGVEMETAGWELEFHSHEKTQLMLSLSGIATCEAEGSVWLVPPGSALFIPEGVMHRVAVVGRIEGYAVFIERTEARLLPANSTTLIVNPLLRELIIRCAQFPTDYSPNGTESRVTALLLDEIVTAPVGGLHLPIPTHPRLRAILQGMMANPADRRTAESWARRAGVSERTLARVISAETGMSLGRWRKQLDLVLALQWMAGGATVKQVALDLGYGSVGSFIAMFRKALGTSPARYVAGRANSPTPRPRAR